MADAEDEKHEDVKTVYKRDKASRKKIDDPEGRKPLRTRQKLAEAFEWMDKRKFLEAIRHAGFVDGSEEFRELVELYDQKHSRW